jgi:hypothetical protein
MLKENPLKMSELLKKKKYYFNEKSPSHILIPEKDGLSQRKMS